MNEKFICPKCQYVSTVQGSCPICFDNAGDEVPMVEQEIPRPCADSMYDDHACDGCPKKIIRK